MARKNNSIKKIMFVILFVLFLPILPIYFIIAKISKSSRQKRYKKNQISGRKLLIACGLLELELMEDFELVDVFKYLFFYDGYEVNVLSKDLSKINMIISKFDQKILVKYDINKYKYSNKHLLKLANALGKKHGFTGLFITNHSVTSDALEFAKKNKIEIMDKSSLDKYLNQISTMLKIEEIRSGSAGLKNIDELYDEMYPNKI